MLEKLSKVIQVIEYKTLIKLGYLEKIPNFIKTSTVEADAAEAETNPNYFTSLKNITLFISRKVLLYFHLRKTSSKATEDILQPHTSYSIHDESYKLRNKVCRWLSKKLQIHFLWINSTIDRLTVSAPDGSERTFDVSREQPEERENVTAHIDFASSLTSTEYIRAKLDDSDTRDASKREISAVHYCQVSCCNYGIYLVHAHPHMHINQDNAPGGIASQTAFITKV